MDLSYLDPLGPGVVHKSEKSITLKVCMIKHKSILDRYFCIFDYPNNSHYSNRAVISIVQITKNLDKWGPGSTVYGSLTYIKSFNSKHFLQFGAIKTFAIGGMAFVSF